MLKFDEYANQISLQLDFEVSNFLFGNPYSECVFYPVMLNKQP